MSTSAVGQMTEGARVNAYEGVAESNAAAKGSETKKSKVTGKTIGSPELSDTAKAYYENLKKKFGNMDFILVSKDMKEQAKASAGQYANANRMVVLVDEEKIERMATDEAYRKQYEGIISNAAAQLPQMQSSLAVSAGSAVKTFGMQIDDGGNASFFAVIDKSLAAQKDRIEKKQEEKIAKKHEDAKDAARKAAKDRYSKDDGKNTGNITKDKNGLSGTQSEEDLVTVTANSMDELLAKISDMLYASMSDYTYSPQEMNVGWNIDFKG